jgi:hypothetical protein
MADLGLGGGKEEVGRFDALHLVELRVGAGHTPCSRDWQPLTVFQPETTAR